MSEHLLNLKFVSVLKNEYPCLYDYNRSDFSNKHVTEKAWEEVGKSINITAIQAKERWKNLRTVFVRNLKAQAKGAKRQKYYLMDVMQFVIPYIKTARANANDSPNIGLTDKVKVEFNYTQETEQNEPPVSPSHSESSYIQYDPLIQSASSPHTCALPSPSPESVSSQRSTRYKRKTSEVDEDFSNHSKSKLLKIEDSSISDANKMFLLSLLPDLNEMSPKQARSFKRQVMDLIDSII